MTVRPILFSGAMVRALLEGRKTQTRRVLNRLQRFGKVTEFGPSDTRGYDWHFRDRAMRWHDLEDHRLREVLPYAVGDRLWVREAWHAAYSADDVAPRDMGPDWKICPAVDWNYADWGIKGRLRAGMHMPRWASRLTLKVTDVRIQRVQDIDHDDAIAEGVLEGETEHGDLVYSGICQTYPIPPEQCWNYAEFAFAELWRALNDERGFGWDVNPWVVAVTFELIKANVDAVLSGQAGAA